MLDAVLFGGAIAAYKPLLAFRHRLQNAFAQCDGQRQRRDELIPNLAVGAHATMAHECGALQEVIAARDIAEAAQHSAAAQPDNAPAVRAVRAAI